jgi:hypothetical protein
VAAGFINKLFEVLKYINSKIKNNSLYVTVNIDFTGQREHLNCSTIYYV